MKGNHEADKDNVVDNELFVMKWLQRSAGNDLLIEHDERKRCARKGENKRKWKMTFRKNKTLSHYKKTMNYKNIPFANSSRCAIEELT